MMKNNPNGQNNEEISAAGKVSENMKGTVDNTKKKISARWLILSILYGIIYTAAVAIFAISVWYKNTFNISFNDLLFTLLSPIEGTGASTVADILWACVPATVLFLPLYIIIVIAIRRDMLLFKILRRVGAAFCSLLLCLSLVFAMFAFRIPQYIRIIGGTSELYETDYVDPDAVNITDKDGNARNLIYIYLESMETTYASKEVGGEQDGVNYMPHMTTLAQENISFSDSDKLGGFRSITGTGWTMGALMGTTSGVPFSLAVFGDQSHNSQGKDGTFVNGLTTIGDILEEKG